MPSSGVSTSKRKIDENESVTEVMNNLSPSKAESSTGLSGQGIPESCKENKTQSADPQSASGPSVSSMAHNFPLPNETGTPCIVRVYSNKFEMKTTDAVEIIGILSVDPALASISEDMEGLEDLVDQEELRAHEPPPSLVPRIHALSVHMLDHNNPYLPCFGLSYTTEKKKLMQDVNSIRLELYSIFEHALLGDRLAAEYLVCHLLAKVYSRVDGIPVGKFCLNLSGCPSTQRYSILLFHLLSQLTTKSTRFEMTIENLNSWQLIPKKDYTANRIRAGMLQLSAGTNLVLDETLLQPGRLDNTGVMNCRALEEMIAWQKVVYDFHWSQVPILCDINTLILSEGSSFLSKDVHLPIVTQDVADIPAHFTLLDKRLTDELLSKLRTYITICKQLDYEVSEHIQKALQDDFVETRQTNPSEMTVDDFQRLLTLLRLLTISYGLEAPSMEIWMKAKAMERERKARVARLPKPTNGVAFSNGAA